MPSLDAETIEKVGPYLDLCSKLGTFVQQIALDKVESLAIYYYGKVMDLDSDSLTRGVLRGFLQNISGRNVNFVNARVLVDSLGVGVDVVNSSEESDYTELIRVQAQCRHGETVSAEGTLMGKGNSPRIVSINDREVELEPCGYVLVVANSDETGIVGQLGTIIGNAGVNIASMSLSRNKVGGIAINLAGLDSPLDEATMSEITSIEAIKQARLVYLEC